MSIALTVLCLLADGCEEQSATNRRQRDASQGVIAFVGAAQDDPIWPILEAGARRFDHEYGMYVVRYDAPAIRSADQQNALIRSLAKDPALRGVCIQPVDADAMVAAFAPLRKRGIRIVSMLTRLSLDDIGGHVGYNETAIGEALAEATTRALDGHGNVMILEDSTASARLADRMEALSQTLRASPGIDVWAMVDCRGDPDAARAEIASRSARYRHLNAWIAPEPWPMMQLRLGENPLPPGQALITVARGPLLWPYIESGACPAVVAFNYHEAGAKALQFCQSAVNDPTRRDFVYDVPVRLVFRSNLDRYKDDWAFWASAQPDASAESMLPAQ